MILGSSVEQGTSSPEHLQVAASLFCGEQFILTFRRETKSAHVILRSSAKTPDYIKAAFSAHVLLYLADNLKEGPPLKQLVSLPPWINSVKAKRAKKPTKLCRAIQQTNAADDVELLVFCQEVVEKIFPLFLERAEVLGWKLSQTMLNPRESRLIGLMQDATKPLIV